MESSNTCINNLYLDSDFRWNDEASAVHGLSFHPFAFMRAVRYIYCSNGNCAVSREGGAGKGCQA